MDRDTHTKPRYAFQNFTFQLIGALQIRPRYVYVIYNIIIINVIIMTTSLEHTQLRNLGKNSLLEASKYIDLPVFLIYWNSSTNAAYKILKNLYKKTACTGLEDLHSIDLDYAALHWHFAKFECCGRWLYWQNNFWYTKLHGGLNLVCTCIHFDTMATIVLISDHKINIYKSGPCCARAM